MSKKLDPMSFPSTWREFMFDSVLRPFEIGNLKTNWIEIHHWFVFLGKPGATRMFECLKSHTPLALLQLINVEKVTKMECGL